MTGKEFFPGLMSAPFKHGLVYAFSFSAVLYLVAAAASWMGSTKRAARVLGGAPELEASR